MNEFVQRWRSGVHILSGLGGLLYAKIPNSQRASRPIGRDDAKACAVGLRQEAAGFLLLLATWFGLLTGLIEVAIQAFRKLYLHQTIHLSQDFVWMTPVADLLFFSIPGLCFFLVSWLWPRVAPLRCATFVFALFGWMNLLLMVPRFHHYAALLLAVGLAVQTVRFISSHALAFRSLVRRSAWWMMALVVVMAASVHGWRLLAERHALAKLPPAPIGAPNLLLITLDTVRARNLSLYNYARPTTPQLERLATTGVVFDQAMSTAPWTLPSHASMFTGRFPHELSADWKTPLDSSHPTLAEFFRARGYLTAGFVANTGYSSYEHGLQRGFTHYKDYRISLGQIVSSSTLVRIIADNFRLRRLVRNDERLNRQDAGQINDDFLRWLSRNRERPFFAFLNYYDAHGPYLPPSPYDRKFGPGRIHGKLSPLHRQNWKPAAVHWELSPQELREEMDAYDGAIAYLDQQIGALFDELRRQGVLKSTLVIITSDHGEEFGEHGVFDHGNSLYLPTVHVPLLISFPPRVPIGMHIREPVTLRDLAATVVDLSGLQGGPRFPGNSLVRYWEVTAKTASSEESPLLCEVSQVDGWPEWFPVSKGDMKSLVLGGIRYIKNGDGSEELYDFEHDPWEKRNLAHLEKDHPTLNPFGARLEAILMRSPASN